MAKPTPGDLLLTGVCGCLLFALGLGSGFWFWGREPEGNTTVTRVACYCVDNGYWPRRSLKHENVERLFIRNLELRQGLPDKNGDEPQVGNEDPGKEVGKLSIDIWEGGHRMPVPHLAHTIERTARFMNIEPRKCIKALLEICAVESDFGIIIRQKGGPALSPWQIEPKTWDNLLAELKERYPDDHKRLKELYIDDKPISWNRSMNIPYAAASAMMYIKVNYPEGFKGLSSLGKRAKLWKRWYNTPQGKGTIERYELKAREHLLNYFNS